MPGLTLLDVLDDGGCSAPPSLTKKASRFSSSQPRTRWICKAPRPAEALNIEHGFMPAEFGHHRVPNERQRCYRFLAESIRWTLISPDVCDGLMFKPSLGDCYMVAGTRAFMDRFYPAWLPSRSSPAGLANCPTWGRIGDAASLRACSRRMRPSPIVTRSERREAMNASVAVNGVCHQRCAMPRLQRHRPSQSRLAA